MKPPVWLDDHIYAAPDCPAIDADFQCAREALNRLPPLLDELPKTHDINALRHLLRAICLLARGAPAGVELPDLRLQPAQPGWARRGGQGAASRGQQLQATCPSFASR